MDKNTALQELTYAAESRRIAEDRIAADVTQARNAGASWSAIGSILGISKQAAQQKYARLLEDLPLSDPVFDPLFNTPQVHDVAPVVTKISSIAVGPPHVPAKSPAKASTLVVDHVAGASVTPSVFLDPLESAPGWDHRDPALCAFPLEGRPKVCSYCGHFTHLDAKGDTWLYPGCIPTIKDPVTA